MEKQPWTRFEDQRLREIALDARCLVRLLYFASNRVQLPDERLDASYATAKVDADADSPPPAGEPSP